MQDRSQVLERTGMLLKKSFLQKGAILPQMHNSGGFYSSLFLVPKKNGQMRSETAQSVGGDTALQDGGYQDLLGGWGLDGEGGSAQFTLNINSI